MALTTAQQVRLRVQDIPAIADLTRTFDGSASAFQLENGAMAYSNIISGTAFVPDANSAWSATGAAFNASGHVTFSAVVSAGSAYRVRFVHSVFSDDEIGHFTAVGGSVLGASIEALYALRFDSVKRAKWAAPDGTEHDDTAAIKALETLYNDAKEEQLAAESFDSGFESWARGQDDLW
jgi:hypothetical protein